MLQFLDQIKLTVITQYFRFETFKGAFKVPCVFLVGFSWGSGRMQEQKRDTRGSSFIFSLYAATEKETGLFWAHATDAMCSHIIPSAPSNAHKITCERAGGFTRTCKSHLSFFWVLEGVSNSAGPVGERNDDVIRIQSITSYGYVFVLTLKSGIMNSKHKLTVFTK